MSLPWPRKDRIVVTVFPNTHRTKDAHATVLMFTSGALPWRSQNLSSPASDAPGFCWQTFCVIIQNQSATKPSAGLVLSLLRSFLSPFTIPLFTIQFYCSPVIAVEKIKRLWVRFRPCPRKEVGDWTSPYTLSLSLSLSLAHTHTVSVSCLHCVGWAEHSCHTVTVSLPPHSLSPLFPLSLLLFLSFPFLYLSSFSLSSLSHTHTFRIHTLTHFHRAETDPRRGSRDGVEVCPGFY